MILKLEACKRALSAGVPQVRIVGGTQPKGLLAAANGADVPRHARDAGVIPRAPPGRRSDNEAKRKKPARSKRARRRIGVGRAAGRIALFDEHLPAAAD